MELAFLLKVMRSIKFRKIDVSEEDRICIIIEINFNEMNDQTFLTLGNIYTKTRSTSSKYDAMRRFQSFFGVTPHVCSLIWDKIKDDVPNGGEPKHLLWSLSFLKQYSVEHYRRSIFNADEKTIRKWSWIFVQLLSNLDAIAWEDRFQGAVTGQSCYCSVDGVDFPIMEPKPFSRLWFSHKFHSAGLRYEVALNIRTGFMVWLFGGYPCGLYSDLKLARETFVPSLKTGERALADKGYKDTTHFILPNPQNSELHNLIMSRHETINRRLKQFRILSQRYRHSLKKHPMVVSAVGNVTQLMVINGHPLFTVI